MELQNNIQREPRKVASFLGNFTADTFKKSFQDMIATSDDAYRGAFARGRSSNDSRFRNEEEINRVLDSGTNEEICKLSSFFYNTDGYYNKIINYYATLLKYQGVLIPNTVNGHSINEQSIIKRYNKSLDFLTLIDLPSLCVNFMLFALIYGAYYGVIQTLDKNTFTILDLPVTYCSTRYKDKNNNDLIDFDLKYFDSIQEEEGREQALSVYPKIIKQAYIRFNKNNGERYFTIPSDTGICFPFPNARPPFLSSIPSINNYKDYVKMEKKKDEEETKKVFIQKIPHLADGRLLFEPPEAQVLHDGVVKMLNKNMDLSVLTTYADASVEGTSSTNESISKNNLEKISQTIYNNAGVSSQIFNANGNLAISHSIKRDLSFVMILANKISNFITNIINRQFGNNQLRFKYNILPISYYNDTEYINNSYKEATAGYSFILPAIALGLSQKDLIDIKSLENDVLKLQDLLIPLKLSFTDSGSQNQKGEEKKPGRPKKEETEKSDKTIKNIEAGSQE